MDRTEVLTKVREQLRESGVPEDLADSLPESLLKNLEGSDDFTVGMAVLHDHGKDPVLKIVNSKKTPEEDRLPSSGLRNTELVLKMMCAWMADDPEALRRFRRFAIKIAMESGHDKDDPMTPDEVAAVIGFFAALDARKISYIGRILN